MHLKLGLIVCTVGSLSFFCHDAWPAGLYGEIFHASNARTTDRDLGRNFVHVGWGFANGFMVSGGAYFAGEKHCFESLTLGKEFAQARWQATLTAHRGGICSVDSRQVPIKQNIGLRASRQLRIRPRWSLGIGGCLWQQPDYAIGNLTRPDHPLSVKDDGIQLTAMLLIRFNLTGGRSGRAACDRHHLQA